MQRHAPHEPRLPTAESARCEPMTSFRLIPSFLSYPEKSETGQRGRTADSLARDPGPSRRCLETSPGQWGFIGQDPR